MNRFSISCKIKSIDRSEKEQFHNYEMIQNEIKMDKVKEIFFTYFSTLQHKEKKIEKVEYNNGLIKE